MSRICHHLSALAIHHRPSPGDGRVAPGWHLSRDVGHPDRRLVIVLPIPPMKMPEQ
jgi:hypothetical protein